MLLFVCLVGWLFVCSLYFSLFACALHQKPPSTLEVRHYNVSTSRETSRASVVRHRVRRPGERRTLRLECPRLEPLACCTRNIMKHHETSHEASENVSGHPVSDTRASRFPPKPVVSCFYVGGSSRPNNYMSVPPRQAVPWICLRNRKTNISQKRIQHDSSIGKIMEQQNQGTLPLWNQNPLHRSRDGNRLQKWPQVSQERFCFLRQLTEGQLTGSTHLEH